MMHLLARAALVASILAALTIGAFQLPTIQSVIQTITKPTTNIAVPKATPQPSQPKTKTPTGGIKITPPAPTQKITVISPNGGEVFTKGQVIPVSFSYQGFPSSTTLGIGVRFFPNGTCTQDYVNNYETSPGKGTVNVATNQRCFASSAIKHNNQYKIIVFKKANKTVGDQSDNAFTINPATTPPPPPPAATITLFANKDFNTSNHSIEIDWQASAPTDANLDMVCTPGSISFSTSKGNNPTCEKGGVWSWQNQTGDSIILYSSGNTQPVSVNFTLTLLKNGMPTDQKNTINIVFPAVSSTATTSLDQIRQKVTISAVSPLTATQVGLSAGQTVAVFKITNNNYGPIYLGSMLTFLNSGSASTTQSFVLYSSSQGGTTGDISITLASTTPGNPSLLPFNLNNFAESNWQINGGTWRYLTIKTRQPAANNDTFQISTGDLTNIQFYVKEADFGQSLNSDSDFVDTIYGLSPIGSSTSTALVIAKT